MVFSQIRTEQAKDVINTAKMHGLEFHILREESDWTTFQFTTHFAKLSFDEMCRQTGVGIHGDYPTTQLTDALDAIVEGAHPDVVLAILEGRSITRGMSNAYTRGGSFRYICASEGCGVSIPSYRGRYPQSCPACGGGLMTAEEFQRKHRRESKRRVRESVTEANFRDAAKKAARDIIAQKEKMLWPEIEQFVKDHTYYGVMRGDMEDFYDELLDQLHKQNYEGRH